MPQPYPRRPLHRSLQPAMASASAREEEIEGLKKELFTCKLKLTEYNRRASIQSGVSSESSHADLLNHTHEQAQDLEQAKVAHVKLVAALNRSEALRATADEQGRAENARAEGYKSNDAKAQEGEARGVVWDCGSEVEVGGCRG